MGAKKEAREIIPYDEIAIIKGTEVRVVFRNNEDAFALFNEIVARSDPAAMGYGVRQDMTPERVFNSTEFERKAPQPSGFVTFKPGEAEKDIQFDCKFPED